MAALYSTRFDKVALEGNPLLRRQDSSRTTTTIRNSTTTNASQSTHLTTHRETQSTSMASTYADGSDSSKIKHESLSDAKSIHPSQLQPILKKLQSFE